MTIKGFEVDAGGLAKLIEHRGRGAVLFELFQNAADEQVTRIDMTLKPIAGRPLATLQVVDDSPDGFRDLAHAYTLFAESYKKDDPTKAGRFNLGEKLVLALCNRATITSTTGSVTFDHTGRQRGRKRTERGTIFTAEIRMTRDQLAEVERAADLLIPPAGVTATFNARHLERPEPDRTLSINLPTLIADDEGNMKRTTRTAKVELFTPRRGDDPQIFELGIPVVELQGGERWHVNVHQKVPLSFQRDNVTPAYLRTLRVAVLNAMHDDLEPEDASSTWARDAAGDDRVEPEAVKTSLDLRFGKARVAYDMADPEANKLATAEGFTVVTGGSLSGDEWRQAKRVEAIKPAGKVTPSPKAYGTGDGPAVEEIDPDLRTRDQQATCAYCEAVVHALIGVYPEVKIVRTHNSFLAAWCGPRIDHSRCPPSEIEKMFAGGGPPELHLNIRALGSGWFGKVPAGDLEPVDELIIHEVAHHYESDHLSSRYHDALCRLGAKLARLNREQPGLGFEYKTLNQAMKGDKR
jgi:hypothetical protein